MDEGCYKDSFQYEFIPGIKLYDQRNIEKVNTNCELSKSENYVLFMKYANHENRMEKILIIVFRRFGSLKFQKMGKNGLKLTVMKMIQH